MNVLDKDTILNATDQKLTEFEVPEWGGTVYIKIMSGIDRDNFELSLYSDAGKTKKENLRNLRSRLLVKVLVDENGKRLFKDNDATDLGHKSSVVLDKLYAAARTINGLSKEDVDELTKNSEEIQDEESILD